MDGRENKAIDVGTIFQQFFEFAIADDLPDSDHAEAYTHQVFESGAHVAGEPCRQVLESSWGTVPVVLSSNYVERTNPMHVPSEMLSDSSDGTSVADRIHATHLAGLSKKDVSRAQQTSLHSSVYYSPEIYSLERRAIFSRQWILISHKARHRDIGDYVQYEMAGFNFVVVKNKDQKIVAFHNICRHRAFSIVQAASGKARIFSCKYHGWSYDLNGKLTKAPRFSDGSVEGFDVGVIRLFPVHVHVDRNGFVYVNLDARQTPEVSWESQYGVMDQQEVLVNAGVDWDKVEYDFTWTKEGSFNWKLMQDNYNEVGKTQFHLYDAHPS